MVAERASWTVFYIVPDAHSATIEQTILHEPLFFLVGELIWEPVPDLVQKPLYPGTKGRGWSLPNPDLLSKIPSSADQRI